MEQRLINDRRKVKTKKIVPGGLFSRTVAAIVDLAIVAFVGGLFYIGGQKIAGKTDVVKDNTTLQREYHVASGLFEYEVVDGVVTSGVVPKISSTDYKDYEAMIINYFTVYKTSECPEEYRDSKYTQYWYNVHILGLEEDPLATPYDDLEELPSFVEKGKDIFQYDEDALDKYNALPLLKEETETMEAIALRYYFIPQNENNDNQNHVYNYATVDLRSTDYFQLAEKTLLRWYQYVPMASGIVLSMLIFYFIIPISTRNGQTLGKLTFHLGLVNKLGYQVQKVQIIERFFFEFFLLAATFAICNSYVPFGLFVFVAIATVYFLASFLLMIFTKEHRAIHDFLALTTTIDMNQSTWFKNASEEAGVEKRIAESKKISFGKKEDYKKNPNILYVNPDFENQEKGDSEDEEKND